MIPALDPTNGPDRAELRESVHNDSVTFFLVRWFEAHHDSHDRDHLHRPIHPGSLHVNHCLWEYAKTQSPRRSVPRDWTASQRKTYYGLIFPQNVLNNSTLTHYNSHIFLHWNNDNTGSSTTCAGTVTYTYTGSVTTLEQSHYYTGYTLEQRRRWIIDNMRWNSHIYIRWIIDNAGSVTLLHWVYAGTTTTLNH